MTKWSVNTNTTAPVHAQQYTLEYSGDTSLKLCVYHPGVFSKLNKIGLISQTHVYYSI